MSTGAIVTVPSKHAANQTRHAVKGDAIACKDANDGGTAECGNSPSRRARHHEPQDLPHVIQLACAAEPAPNQPSRDDGLSRVEEAERDGDPDVPADHEVGGDGREHHAGGHGQTGVRPKDDQRTYGDARGRPEDGQSVRAKGKPKPSCREVGDADCRGELDRAKPGVIGVLQGERRPSALLVRHPKYVQLLAPICRVKARTIRYRRWSLYRVVSGDRQADNPEPLPNWFQVPCFGETNLGLDQEIRGNPPVADLRAP